MAAPGPIGGPQGGPMGRGLNPRPRPMRPSLGPQAVIIMIILSLFERTQTVEAGAIHK